MAPVLATPESLLVAQCLGTTFRSEGPSAGQLATVIHLSPYTLSYSPPSQGRRFTVGELVEWAVSSPARLIVITGGEPLLQHDGLTALATHLAGLGYRVEIETHATLAPTPELTAATHLFVVSPRPHPFAAAASSPAHRINDEALTAFLDSGRAVFTFVVHTLADIEDILELEQRLGLYPIWVMPPGTTPVRVLAGLSWLADHALTHGWHLSSRLLVLLGGTP